MTRRRASRALTGLAALSLLAGPGATAEAAAAPPPACRASGAYLVVSRDRAEDPGQDIYVTSGPGQGGTRACSYAPKPADFVLTEADASVLALQGKVLLLDTGTGPDRSLVVYDVAARRRLYGVAYDDARKVVSGPDGFTYWRIGDPAIEAALCPKRWRTSKDNAGATRAHRSYEAKLTLADGRPRDTGATDCVRTQSDMD